jgi:hypothetical protein
VIKLINERVVAMAQSIATSRRMRVDITVVEKQHPLSDRFEPARRRVRVLKKSTAIACEAGARLRDRSRSVLEIARAEPKGSQSRGGSNRARQTAHLDQPGGWPSEKEIAGGGERAGDVVAPLAPEGLPQQLDQMAQRVKQMMTLARARISGGDTRAEGKLLGLPGVAPVRRPCLGRHVSFRIRWAQDSPGPNGDGMGCRSLR